MQGAERRALTRGCIAVRSSEQEDLFIRKLDACCVLYDFDDASAEAADAREAKRIALADISEYASSRKGAFTERAVQPLIQMVTANVDRPLPSRRPRAAETEAAKADAPDPGTDGDEDEEERLLEPAWSHLELVYELLRRFVASPDVDRPAARAALTPRFVRTLVDLFRSDDPRERDALKTILHRVYGKTMPLRAPARVAIQRTFLRVIHERVAHPGLPELLEVLGAIVNGFSVPLKREHVGLLLRSLLPLHGARNCAHFHQQLAFVVAEFVNKQPALAPSVLRAIVRHWPASCTRTQVLFLNELEEIIELATPTDTAPVVGLLFRRLAECTKSLHFQVAERALYFWDKPAIVALFVHYRARLMPIVVGALYENVHNHWNVMVQTLSFHVQSLLHDLDPDLYTESLRRYEQRLEAAPQEQAQRQERWRRLDRVAECKRRARAAATTAEDASASDTSSPTSTNPQKPDAVATDHCNRDARGASSQHDHPGMLYSRCAGTGGSCDDAHVGLSV